MNERRTDFELLRNFSRHGEQEAFATLVHRHLNLVYSIALRKLESETAAEDVAQNVFATLARKAWRFAPDDSLPAWLYRTTLLETKEWWRAELRRRRRELAAAELGTTMKTSQEPSAFRALVPLLDEALLSLRERDRTALLLRFYEGQSLRDVGASLGVSEDAAQKRVAAALEQVEQFFLRRGFRTVTAAGAAAALEHTAASASAATLHVVIHTALQAAPPALAGLSGLLARAVSLSKSQKVLVALSLAAIPIVWHWSLTRPTEPVPVRPVETSSPVAATVQPATVAMPAAPPGGIVDTSPLPAAVAVVVPLRTEAPDAIRLTGLINLADCRVALLDIYIRTGLRSNDLARTNHWILKEGESFEQEPFQGGRLLFELRQLDFDQGRIFAQENGQDTQIGAAGPGNSWFSSANLPHGKPTVGLRGANFCDVLDLYGTFLGRTILCYPNLNSSPIELFASAGDGMAAARAIERTLKERGVATAQLGDRFELVAPADKVRSIVQRAGLPLTSEDTQQPTVQAGAICLDNVSWSQVLGLYADLTGRRWQGNNPPAGNLFFLHNQTPLTKAEILYAFDTLLSWQGFKTTPIDENSFRLVRVQKP